MPDLSPEDAKLVTLARATRARTGSSQGAAVRDENGRTYAAAAVALPSLALSAVSACVAMATSSGSRGLECVVLLGDEDTPSEHDLNVVREFAGSDVAFHLGDARGQLLASTRS